MEGGAGGRCEAARERVCVRVHRPGSSVELRLRRRMWRVECAPRGGASARPASATPTPRRQRREKQKNGSTVHATSPRITRDYTEYTQETEPKNTRLNSGVRICTRRMRLQARTRDTVFDIDLLR